MTREQVTSIFADATADQINSILNLHSADISKTKASSAQISDDLKSVTAQLAEAKNTIAALEASKGDLEALQKQIDEYKAADEKRSQEAKEAAEKQELLERFNVVAGDRQFIHEMVKNGVMSDFANALKDKANRGKGDAEIFDAITKDKGYFANQNPTVPIQPKMGDPSPASIKTREEFLKMSFADQLKFKQTNTADFERLFHNK